MAAYELHHVVEGPAGAPAIVLLGSLGSDLAMWQPQAQALRGELRVVRVDGRGHGGSPVPPGPYTAAELGGDVLATLDSLGIERASLCGASLGGSVAMWLAANAPQRVERLCVCFSSAFYGGRGGWLQRAALVRSEGTAAVADAVVERWFTPALAVRDPGAVARMRAMIAATPAEGYAGSCEALADFDLRDQLGQIAAPTLVLSGSEDPATPAEHGECIAAAIPGARFVLVEGVAHLGSFERPDFVNGLIREHLNQRGGTS
jgi:3-oxoadipate enol-lactonase